MNRFDKLLILVSMGQIDLENVPDSLGNATLCDGCAQSFTEHGVISCRSAQSDLIPLLAALIDAENTDVSYVMVTTGIHATRHFQLHFAEVVKIVELVELFVDLRGHVD